MALFVVRHLHTAERCPARDPYEGASLLNYLSRPSVARFGVKIRGEAVVKGEHTLYLIVEADDESQVGQQIQIKGTVYPFNVTLTIVVTISGKAPPDFLLFQRDYLEEAAGRPGFVDNMWVRVDKPQNVPQVIAAIDEGFANSSAETLSESEAAFLGSFMEMYRTFFKIAELLGFIVVLTIGLVAANTAAMSIREWHGEIAVMRSIGFRSRTILTLLLSESLLIGLAGGLIGCGAAYIVLKVFSIGDLGGPLGAISMRRWCSARRLSPRRSSGSSARWCQPVLRRGAISWTH